MRLFDYTTFAVIGTVWVPVNRFNHTSLVCNRSAIGFWWRFVLVFCFFDLPVGVRAFVI